MDTNTDTLSLRNESDQALGKADALGLNSLVVSDDAFLTLLGKRVRDLRERRGMSRKHLAQQADVSERYLAQLETGSGNASVVLLRRVAVALNVPVHELLLRDADDSVEKRLIRRFLERLPLHRLEDVIFRLMREFGQEEVVRRQRVALIGLRGAGKSTLGKLLAEEMRVPFLELNREIERETGMPLGEIFSLYGQAGYRRIERNTLDRVLNEHDRAVISIAGGVVAEESTFTHLTANCFTVWLKAEPEEHMQRVIDQGDLRPMAGHSEAMDDLKNILTAREPLYRKADAILETTGQTPKESLEQLRQVVKI